VPRTQVHAPSASGLFDTVPCPVRQYGSYAEACAAIRVVGERIAAGGLPPSVSPLTIAIHGTGNVGRGALHALRHLGDDVLSVVKTPAALAHVAGESASHRVFAVVLSATDVVMPLEPGAPFERAEYYAHPERYRPVLHELLSSISLLIHCAGWDMRYPRLLTAAQLATSAAAAREAGLPHAKLQMIADVSCDLPGALESLVRTTTSRAPFYIYDPVAAAERVCPAGGSGATEMRGEGVAVLAHDTLPSELPKDASEQFGDALFPFVLSLADLSTSSRTFVDQLDTSAVGGPFGLPREVWAAVITCDGELTRKFEYIRKIRDTRSRVDAQVAPPGSGKRSRSVLRLSGHIFDSGLINTALDLIEDAGGCVEILEVCAGNGAHGTSSAVMTVELPSPSLMAGENDTASSWTPIERLVSRLRELARARPAASASITILPPTFPGGSAGGAAATGTAMAGGTVDGAAASPLDTAASSLPQLAGSPTQHVTLLGAGFCALPALELLSRDGNTFVHLVSVEPGAAAALCRQLGRANVLPHEADADLASPSASAAAVSELIGRSDAVLSLLPARMHAPVARACVAQGTPLVTASYVDDCMRELSPAAAAAGVPILVEMGLDPGLDHISACELLARVRARGGLVREFRSVCGGLPSAEVAARTPLAYKFSWSPQGVFSALEQPAAFLRDGKCELVGGGDALLASARPYAVGRLGNCYRLEVIPNRDALLYAPLYGLGVAGGLGGLRALFRGTLRYEGFAAQMAMLRSLMSASATVPGGVRSWAELARHLRLLDARRGEGEAATRVRKELLRELGALSPAEKVRAPGTRTQLSVRDAFCALLARQLAYAEDERDLVLMQHEVVVEWPAEGGVETTILSTLVLAGGGAPGVPSAMARTVGLTAALGVRLLLSERGRASLGGGVHIPTHPAVWGALLPLLEAEGVRFDESCSAAPLARPDPGAV